MENYYRHNDLISNFFYLIKNIYPEEEYFSVVNEIPNSIKDRASFISFQVLNDEFIDEKDLMDFILNNLPKEIKELREIIRILKINTTTNLFDSYLSLLTSRYFSNNWRLLIKKSIKIELEKGNNFKNLQNQIIFMLNEIRFRTDLNYTVNTHYLLLCFENEYEEWLDFSSNSIDNDIKWIKNLGEKELENKKIILNSKFKKSKLISLIKEYLEGKRESKNSNKRIVKNIFYHMHIININLELDKFIDFITNRESISIEYDLFFLKTKNEVESFAKLFLLLYSKGLIINKTKGELTKILGDSLNISESTLNHSYSKKALINELDIDSTPEAILVNELFLN